MAAVNSAARALTALAPACLHTHAQTNSARDVVAALSKRLLHRSARDSSVEMMPARGLTLVEVGYPDPREWAARAQQARHRRDASELDTPEPAVNLEGNQP